MNKRLIFTILTLGLALVHPMTHQAHADSPAKAKAQELLEIRLATFKAQPGFSKSVKVGQKTVYLSDKDMMTFKDVGEVKAHKDQKAGLGLALTFTAEGAKKFAALTGKNVGKAMAFILKGKVVSAPQIKDKIADGRLLINLGKFDHFKALLADLKARLKARQKK